MESQILEKAAKSLGSSSRERGGNNQRIRILLCDKSAKVKTNGLIWTQAEVVLRRLLQEFDVIQAPKNQQSGNMGQTAAWLALKSNSPTDNFFFGRHSRVHIPEKDTTFKMSQ